MYPIEPQPPNFACPNTPKPCPSQFHYTYCMQRVTCWWGEGSLYVEHPVPETCAPGENWPLVSSVKKFIKPPSVVNPGLNRPKVGLTWGWVDGIPSEDGWLPMNPELNHPPDEACEFEFWIIQRPRLAPFAWAKLDANAKSQTGGSAVVTSLMLPE
jgi:hypothetical protein